MTPGPDLGLLLSRVDLDRLNGYDAVVLARAAARQVSHEQARLLACLATIARCQPGDADTPPARRPGPDLDRAVDEIAFALRLTRTAAGVLLGLAEDALTHPALGAALAAGVLDLPRLRVIADAIASLQAGESAEVMARILPVAGELTTGQLRVRLARLVLCVDPAGATRRRDQAVNERRVAHYTAADGTATLTAIGLPVERAAAAWQRLHTLATTAKRDGDTRTLDQLRADLMMDLLDGTTRPTQPPDHPVGLHVVAPLDTLRGMSEEPGHLSGWGPIAADVLRRLAADPTGERRMQVSVLDDQGRLIGTVITARHRFPTAAQARHVHARDLTCRAPGCQMPASRCQIDHTIAYAAGGPTLTAHLGALCAWHHVGKHTRGYRLRQTRPGQFTWITPLGHVYRRREEHPP